MILQCAMAKASFCLEPLIFWLNCHYCSHTQSLCVLMQTAFTTKKDYGKGEREAQWAVAQRTMHGLQVPEGHKSNHHHEHSEIAEQAKRRAEAAR